MNLTKLKSTISVNIKVFYTIFVHALSVLFAIASAILLFFEKDELKIKSFATKSGILIGILIVSVIVAVLYTFFYKNEENIKGKLYTCYDDLLSIAFNKKNEKKIVVISVNTTFDTIIDDNISGVQHPLVSPKSVHGMWISRMLKTGKTLQELDKEIADSLSQQGIHPVLEIDKSIKKRGKRKCYKKGTIARVQYNNTTFFLLALSEFDNNNNAQNTKEELIETIINLIDYYNCNGNGLDLYIPLLGTGLSRTNITEKESLELLTSMFTLFSDKIPGKTNIIVYKKNRHIVSIKD